MDSVTKRLWFLKAQTLRVRVGSVKGGGKKGGSRMCSKLVVRIAVWWLRRRRSRQWKTGDWEKDAVRKVISFQVDASSWKSLGATDECLVGLSSEAQLNKCGYGPLFTTWIYIFTPFLYSKNQRGTLSWTSLVATTLHWTYPYSKSLCFRESQTFVTESLFRASRWSYVCSKVLAIFLNSWPHGLLESCWETLFSKG